MKVSQKTVKISDISIDGDTQQREKISTDIVSEYAEAMRCGAKFPPVTIFHDGVAYWLADGFHRFHASREAEIGEILADVRDGTKRDARLFSASANGTHGMRLTNADKRRSVMVLLSDAEWSKWSNRDIAKHCHVTHTMVNRIRDEVETVSTVKVKSQVETVSTSPEDSKDGEGVTKSQNTSQTRVDAGYDPRDDELETALATVVSLAEENDRLKDRLAVEQMAGSEEDRLAASRTIDGLRAQVRKLEAELEAVKTSRDTYQRENGELKRQCAQQRREIDKLRAKHG